jgi:predicted nucleotidyltransferase
MLEKLFGSNSRAKIIKQFFFHPEERFYLRQLARDLSLQVNSVRRELENLLELGLISEQASPPEEPKTGQDKKYYIVNKDFILYEDLKSLVAKSQMLYKDDMVESLKKLGNIKLLVLTGVFVNNFSSAVDILIVGKVNKEKLVKIINNLEKELGREVNFTLMTSLEFKYRREIMDIFVYDILDGEKIVVIDEMEITS